MLPSLVVDEVRRGVAETLRTQFAPSTEHFRDAVRRLVEDPGVSREFVREEFEQVAPSMESIRDGIMDFIGQCLEENRGTTVGVMAPTTTLRDQLAKQIQEAGYKIATVNHRERLSRKDAQLFAMTLHRAKGLEFDAVVIVVNRDLDKNLRRLVDVGMARAKREAKLYY